MSTLEECRPMCQPVSSGTLIRRLICLQNGSVFLGIVWGWLAFRQTSGMRESWLDHWIAPGAGAVVLLIPAAFGPGRGNAGRAAAALACYQHHECG